MRAVGVKVLKAKFSEYLRLVQAGETIYVTDRDQIIAEIHTPGAGRVTDIADARLLEMMRKGWLTAAAACSSLPPLRAPLAKLEGLLAELAQDREDR